MNIMGKQIGKTEKGNKYIILQDSPATFHLSVDCNNIVGYDFIENPANMEELQSRIIGLETELEGKINTI